MDWNMWIHKSGPAEWTQAIFSVLSFILAFWALIVSKKANKTVVETKLRPLEMYFQRNSFDNFIVKLYNTGPGIAYEVKVSAYETIGHKERKAFLKGIWTEHKVVFAEGTFDIQPNQATEFVFKGLDIFYFHHKRPVMISYKLANNKRYNTYFNFLMGENKKQRISQMSMLEIILYRFYYQFFVDRIRKAS